MTAALAAAGRAVLGAALVLACAAAALWAALSPMGPWTTARLAVACAVILGAVEAWERLGNRYRGGGSHADTP